MNLNEVDRLVSEYRDRGLFLDANLTVLLVVGALSPERIPRHKRTSAYDFEDFDLLQRFCTFFPRVATLPNVLTEASILLRDQDEQLVLRALCIERWEETTIPSRTVAAAQEYPYLGLADSAILEGIVGSFLVLTDDGPLVTAIQARAGAALHFDWIRVIGMRQ